VIVIPVTCNVIIVVIAVIENDTSNACVTQGRIERCIQVGVRNFEGKGPCGRSSRTWKEIINIDIKEI
jgi:hypothetical protein